MEVKEVAKEWEIYDEKEEVVKKLMPKQFYKWIKSLRRNNTNKKDVRSHDRFEERDYTK